MGTIGRETQDTGRQDWHYSPLPNGVSRTVHHPTGSGGGCSGGLKEHGDRTGVLQGGARSGTHGEVGSSGGQGGSRDSLARPHRPWLYSPPQKKIIGEIRLLGALWKRRLLGAQLRSGHRRVLSRSGHRAWVSRDQQACHTHCRWGRAADGGGLAWAANGGGWGRAANSGGLAGAANGGGLAGAANDGGLVLARARTLPRHRKTPSLQLSPVVSGRFTGRWWLASSQNSLLRVASYHAVATASLQNSPANS